MLFSVAQVLDQQEQAGDRQHGGIGQGCENGILGIFRAGVGEFDGPGVVWYHKIRKQLSERYLYFI